MCLICFIFNFYTLVIDIWQPGRLRLMEYRVNYIQVRTTNNNVADSLAKWAFKCNFLGGFNS